MSAEARLTAGAEVVTPVVMMSAEARLTAGAEVVTLVRNLREFISSASADEAAIIQAAVAAAQTAPTEEEAAAVLSRVALFQKWAKDNPALLTALVAVLSTVALIVNSRTMPREQAPPSQPAVVVVRELPSDEQIERMVEAQLAEREVSRHTDPTP